MNITPDNVIIVNGRTIKMTPEIVAKLKYEGIIPKYASPFDRVEEGDTYYGFSMSINEPCGFPENKDMYDDKMFDQANYFNNEDFAVMIGLRYRLWRELLKFSYDTDTHMTLRDMEPKNRIGMITPGYVIKYNPQEHEFEAANVALPGICDVVFVDLAAAEEAIEKVVKPFVKQHPKVLMDF